MVISVQVLWTRQVKKHQCQLKAKAQARSGLAKIGFTQQQKHLKSYVVFPSREVQPATGVQIGAKHGGGKKKEKNPCPVSV